MTERQRVSYEVLHEMIERDNEPEPEAEHEIEMEKQETSDIE